jgi:hypothetical protein
MNTLHIPPLPISMHLDIVEHFAKSIRNERMNWHDATGSDGCGQALKMVKVGMFDA